MNSVVWRIPEESLDAAVILRGPVRHHLVIVILFALEVLVTIFISGISS